MGENGMYRILVCDDERDIVSALRIYLTAEGYEVLEAYNGSEMLRLAATQEVHLILLDVMMPGMDGQFRCKKEGREEGREEGRKEEKRALVQKKLEKGKTISQIADDLEDTEENIAHLIEEFHLRV